MEKNYYQILEIDKNASQEIIKKAYTTLAKKYHPDLQEDSQKHVAEEKIKLINQAYETLSNEEKRKQYDLKLSTTEIDTDKLIHENSEFKDKLNKYTSIQNQKPNYTPENNINSTNNPNSINHKATYNNHNYNRNLQYQNEIRKAREQAYHDAYVQDLRNRGYKIRYKRTLKDYIKNFIALICTIFIVILVFQIPFVKKFFVNMYNDNPIINFIVDFCHDLIINIFKK